MRTFLFLLFLATAPFGAPAQSSQAHPFDEAAKSAEQRLREALSELNATRERIAAERVPQSLEIAELKQRYFELKQERDTLRHGADSDGLSMDQLRAQVEALQASEDFIDEQLIRFAREFQSRIHYAENQKYASLLKPALHALGEGPVNPEDRRAALAALVRASIDRLEKLIGGYRFSGIAVGGENDAVHEGTFIAVGPEVYFHSKDGSLAGISQPQTDGAPPAVVPLDNFPADSFAAVARTRQGVLPFDPTLGTALKVSAARKDLGQYIEDGNAIGYVILALGAIVLCLSTFKVYETCSFRAPRPEEVDAVLEHLRENPDAARQQAEQLPGAARALMRLGVEHASEPRTFLEDMLLERVFRFRPQLERFLPFLAIAAAAAPLLGLLGTVVGMIKTFELITVFGTGDAQSLSSGISEALITTALGLIVAIPTLVAHGILSRLAKGKINRLEQAAVAFINGLPGKSDPRESDLGESSPSPHA